MPSRPVRPLRRRACVGAHGRAVKPTASSGARPGTPAGCTFGAAHGSGNEVVELQSRRAVGSAVRRAIRTDLTEPVPLEDGYSGLPYVPCAGGLFERQPRGVRPVCVRRRAERILAVVSMNCPSRGSACAMTEWWRAHVAQPGGGCQRSVDRVPSGDRAPRPAVCRLDRVHRTVGFLQRRRRAGGRLLEGHQAAARGHREAGTREPQVDR